MYIYMFHLDKLLTNELDADDFTLLPPAVAPTSLLSTRGP